ncbi:clostripain-related cysteine peptidase [uncultured Bacteroides sp.]|uniref:clostripain-related cysteine peptidase n=1 Tax=uncultured Bacteroides sp. TaxID=162156 RepID=UPI0025DA266D|nr:clostripain-related cysteine peptidase [uncultured Bacteroides sp.]
MRTKLYFLLWICFSVLFVSCGDNDGEPDVIAITGIELNRSELSLKEGKSETLIATITPDNATNKKVTWKSSDTSVATVDVNGKVTALKSGRVTITVITEDGAKYDVCIVTCGDGVVEPEVPVTGVELNEKELSLVEGESETLEAIITPEDATNKKVTWSSNNESIAMVGADGKVTALRAGEATIIAVTEDAAKSVSCKVTVESGMPLNGSRTVLVYLAADNSLSSLASQDLAEMKVGMAEVEDSNVHVLVYIDVRGKSSPRLLELKNENGKVVETVVKTYEKRNSVGVAETQEVFADVFSNSKYKADSYGLVYWSHGDGWLPYPLRADTRWVGQDTEGDTTDNRMNISEFAEILKTAPRFDFILFDACFMQSVEVAYELRDYTDYCIGSPTEIPGPGASYDEVIPAMFSAEDAAVNIARAYYEPYAAKYDSGNGITNNNWTGGVSVCALKTDQLGDLAKITKQILPEAADKAQLRSSVFDYDKRGGSGGYQDGHVGYYDLLGMMRLIADDSAYATWKRAFDATVAYWNTTPMNYSSYVAMFSMENTNGVSCYIPTSSNNLADKAYRSTEWYTVAGFSELNW